MKILLLVTIYTFFSSTAWSEPPLVCNDLLIEIQKNPQQPEVENTNGLIGYLGDLVENHVIGERDLLRFINDLENGIVQNPISEKDAQTNSSLFIHRQGLEEYINKKIDHQRLLSWATLSLEGKKEIRVSREETQGKTQEIHNLMEFGKIAPGTFKTERGMELSLTKTFEMMTTPVTQRQWFSIMNDNPSKFNNGKDAIVVTINGKQIKMQPNNPVEMVSWVDVQELIKKLNKLCEENDPILYRVISNHNKGDQYRLPIEAEWEFVVKNRNRANGKYYFGNNETDLGEYAWYWDNNRSDGGANTHPVAVLKPLLIDGTEFYDLHGNVKEWVQDWYAPDIKGEMIDLNVGNSVLRVTRGGSWFDQPHILESNSRGARDPKQKSSEVGFRLVRVRP